MPEENNLNRNIIVLTFVVIALAAAVYFFIKNKTANNPLEENQKSDIQYTKNNVDVKKVDLNLAKTLAEKLPAGFPNSIPVEIENIVDGYTMNYKDEGVMLHSIRYESEETVSKKFSEYLNFMVKSGFSISKDGQDEKNGVLIGDKDNDNLTILIGVQAGKTSVLISYLNRP